MLTSQPRVALHYEVDRVADDWALAEEPVPESRPHDLIIDLIKCLLIAWAAREGRRALVGRNLAVRWDEEHPKVGVDPDVYVVEPPPPEGDALTSLRLAQKDVARSSQQLWTEGVVGSRTDPRTAQLRFQELAGAHPSNVSAQVHLQRTR